MKTAFSKKSSNIKKQLVHMLLKCKNTPMSQVAFNEKDKTAWLYEMSNVQNTGSNHWLKVWYALFHPSFSTYPLEHMLTHCSNFDPKCVISVRMILYKLTKSVSPVSLKKKNKWYHWYSDIFWYFFRLTVLASLSAEDCSDSLK